MNLGLPMPPEFFGVVEVKRYASGSYVDGRWTEAAPTDITVRACVQPAGMREMMSLEEGERVKDQLAIWTPDLLQTLDEKAMRRADRIVWQGELWEVRKVEQYDRTPALAHYHVIAVREQKR